MESIHPKISYHFDRERSFKYQLWRKIWVKAGKLHKFAGKKMIAMVREAEQKDCESGNFN